MGKRSCLKLACNFRTILVYSKIVLNANTCTVYLVLRICGTHFSPCPFAKLITFSDLSQKIQFSLFKTESEFSGLKLSSLVSTHFEEWFWTWRSYLTATAKTRVETIHIIAHETSRPSSLSCNHEIRSQELEDGIVYIFSSCQETFLLHSSSAGCVALLEVSSDATAVQEGIKLQLVEINAGRNSICRINIIETLITSQTRSGTQVFFFHHQNLIVHDSLEYSYDLQYKHLGLWQSPCYLDEFVPLCSTTVLYLINIC